MARCIHNLRCAYCGMSTVSSDGLADVPVQEAGSEPGGPGARVAAALRRELAARSAGEVAASLGLPLETTRWHLERLASAGLVVRVRERRQAPGRPRVLYEWAAREPNADAFELLADLLTGVLSQVPDGMERARQAGRTWGAQLPSFSTQTTPAPEWTGMERAQFALGQLGFSPRRMGPETLLLSRCPFKAMLPAGLEVVCAAHLGMLQGLVATAADTSEVALDTSGGPGACRVHVRAARERQGRNVRGNDEELRTA